MVQEGSFALSALFALLDANRCHNRCHSASRGAERPPASEQDSQLSLR